MTGHDPATMPALYIGHGAPPLLDDPTWSGQLADLAATLPTPTGILIVSAHWEAAPLALSATGAASPLVYDFSGFNPKYYRETYPTPDAAGLAQLITSTLPDSASVHQHTSRGLDHGAWVPAKIMYPDADIPTLQLPLPTSDPETLLELGRRLRPLRDHGILLIGSGFLTHGLPYLTDWRLDATPPTWSVEFDAWAHETLAAGDIDTLTRYADVAPGMPYAHPTVEHLTPLFVAAGAADTPDTGRNSAIDGFWMGLSKRSYIIE